MNSALATHPDEGVLIRILDDVLEVDEAAEAQRHIAQCPSCRERLDELRILSRGWTRILDGSDAALRNARPHHTAHPPRWLLRAAGVVLAAGIVAAPPVRAGIARVWERMTSQAPAEVVSAETADDALALSFPFSDTAFILGFDQPQPAGSVVIIFGGEGTDVTARVESGEGAELLVRPDGLHVRNAASATASYRVDLPAGVRAVSVRIAGELTRSLRAGSAVRIEVPLRR